jgi:hypothetical protein
MTFRPESGCFGREWTSIRRQRSQLYSADALIPRRRFPTNSASYGGNLDGPDVRRYDTHFAASEGQHFEEDDQEETWREFLHQFQPIQQPTLLRVGH